MMLKPILMLISCVLGDRIKDSIYTDIQSIRPCFRRLNGTGEVGCTSSVGGEVGVVQYIDTEQDIETRILGGAEEFAPFVVLLNPAILSGDLLSRLRSSGKVVGVVLPGVEEGRWKGQWPSQGFSGDRGCPNSGVYGNMTECQEDKPWNSGASDSMWVDWGFPIFLVQDTNSTEMLYNCWSEHNTKTPLVWPLCAIELKSNMYAAKDSQTCIRRSKLFNLTPVTVCDPLSDNNIHYFVTARNSTSKDNTTVTQEDNSVIVVSARLDALAMFDQTEVGFDTPSTGIVTLLATAKLVAKAIKSRPYKNKFQNILFILFHGESFDYIGSSRLLYDMDNDVFPFDLEKDNSLSDNGIQPLFGTKNIAAWIDLGQLSNKEDELVYMHNNNPGDLLEALRSNAGSLTTLAVTGLPPSSIQPFVNQGLNIPSVVLTNFEKQFTNKMYHSVYDSAIYHGYDHSNGTGQSVVRHLARVAEMVAKTVVSLATVGPTPVMESPTELVNSLLQCYTQTANCSMYRDASDPSNYPWISPPEGRRDTPFPQYVGVRSSYHTLMTKLMLQYLTGEVIDLPVPEQTGDQPVPDIDQSRSDCLAKNQAQNVYSYVFLVGEKCHNISQVECGQCYKTTVSSTEAASPAFLPTVSESYDWSSGKYPTWTESIWKVISGRVFLKGDPSHDHSVFALGVIVAVLSVPVVWWLEQNVATICGNHKSDITGAQPVNM